MKKRLTEKYLCVALATAVAACGLCGCSKDVPTEPPPPETCTVTVNGGAGGGEYNVGAECEVTAYVPRGYTFIEWRNYDYPVSYDNPYRFYADFDVTLEAVIQKLPVQKHTVTVVGGFIGDAGLSDAQIEEGETVTVKPAESQSQKFVKWIVNGKEYTDKTLTLTVSKNTVVTGVYDEYCMVAVNGGTVDGERSKILPARSSVTVKAAPGEKQMFRYWYTLDEDYSEKRLSEDEEYTFDVSRSVKLYAKYDTKCSVTVTGGTVKETGENTLDTFADTEYTLIPDAPPEGKVFVGWYKDGAKISISTELAVTINGDCEYEAHFNTPTLDKLPKPTSAKNTIAPKNGLIKKGDNGTLELDRVGSAGTSMFTQGASFVKFNIYESETADVDKPIGAFKVTLNPESKSAADAATLSTMDGKHKVAVSGEPKSYYVGDYAKFEYILVKALGITEAGARTLYFAPQLISENAVKLSMENDDAYMLTSSDVAKIQTGGIILDVKKRDTPLNANSDTRGQAYIEPSGSMAVDRVEPCNYREDTDYLIWYFYDSPSAEKNEPLAALRFGAIWDAPHQGGAAMVGYVAYEDGSGEKWLLRGNRGNYWIQDSDLPAFKTMVRNALGDKYSSDKSYYIACREVAKTGAYIESDISDIAPNGIGI